MSQNLSGVDSQGSCMWNPEGCTRVKLGSTIIFAALAAIATVCGVLLILAQHGVTLGGINSIAQRIEAKWVYLGTGLAASVFLFSTAYLVHQRCSHSKSKEYILEKKWPMFEPSVQPLAATGSAVPEPENPCYTEEQSLGLRGPVSDAEWKCRGVQNGEYRTCDVLSDSGKTTIFVLVINKDNEKSSFDFKTPKGRQDYIQSLEGMVDQRELERAISNTDPN